MLDKSYSKHTFRHALVACTQASAFLGKAAVDYAPSLGTFHKVHEYVDLLVPLDKA